MGLEEDVELVWTLVLTRISAMKEEEAGQIIQRLQGDGRRRREEEAESEGQSSGAQALFDARCLMSGQEGTIAISGDQVDPTAISCATRTNIIDNGALLVVPANGEHHLCPWKCGWFSVGQVLLLLLSFIAQEVCSSTRGALERLHETEIVVPSILQVVRSAR